MRPSLILVFILLSAPAVQAQMYRWVDVEGKVHFSDKKPKDAKAEDISDSIKPTNTDFGGRDAKQQLQHYERNKAAKRTEKKQSEEHASAVKRQRNEQCQTARKHLKVIQGRVIFYDKNNNEIKVSETERAQRAQELEAQIKKYCE